MLEISINMIDARCRNFLDDLASRDQPKIRLTYRFCENVKSISIFSILLLSLLTAVAVLCIQNKPALHEEESSKREEKDDICALVKGFQEMFRTMKMNISHAFVTVNANITSNLLNKAANYIPSSLIAMSSPSSPTESGSTPVEPISTWKLVLVASIAVGIHLVNAVQIAWLIPIYGELKIPDKLTSLVWFVGVVSSSHRALIIFGTGLWMLEISINMIDARCRDFLDDLASRDQPKIRLAFQFFSFFMAVRKELGYLAALFSRFDVMLSFTVTKACDRFCANVKNISIFSILLLPLLTAVAVFCVQNKPALHEEESSEREEKDDICALVKRLPKNISDHEEAE
ncbi:hypothetical protein Ahy_A04g017969 [Arachis hypogaea]|uniref:Uncharacterized protein n=2 Tax=Arachis hypogaea TaxID=3818 RepID=A0A445DCL3_ARAHY|nr:hypothetical protein Ahy_A04g017969 [Arachis hypogaea]